MIGETLVPDAEEWGFGPRRVATLMADGSVTLHGWSYGGEILSTVQEDGTLVAVEVKDCSVEAASKLAQILDVEVRMVR